MKINILLSNHRLSSMSRSEASFGRKEAYFAVVPMELYYSKLPYFTA